DSNENSRLRLLLDEIFGPENFRNEIVIRRTAKHTVHQFEALSSLQVAYDSLLVYSKSSDKKFNPPLREASKRQKEGSWHVLFNRADRPTMRYPLLGKIINKGQWMWQKDRAYKAVENYRTYVKEYSKKMSLKEYWEKTGKKLEFIRANPNSGEPEYWVAPRELVPSDTNWLDIQAYSFTWNFATEKSEHLLKRIIEMGSDPGDRVADFFVGCGTTLAVAEKLGRKWIGVDMGDFFNNVLLKRMKAVLAGEQSGISREVNWKGGGFFKYHYVEQYEDTLNNIVFREKDKTIQETLESFQDYFLRYMLDYETKDSPTRLNIEQFQTPFDYKIWVTSSGEKRLVTVDLIETFNYLLGLNVEKFRAFKDNDREYLVVFGKKKDESIAIIWRNSKDLDLKRDKEFIENTILAGIKPDRIFINGDSLVEKAEPIEPTFKSLMGA
ncbi:site-specific DNA-methyltransferase, partial [Candidatus Bathyarchaeota archaeon]